jgi:thioredoxin 1
MGGFYIEITSKEEFTQKVLQSKIPVLVDFWAPWCGPCRMASPVVEAIAQEYTGKVLVAKVNTDENSDIAGEYGIMSIPTFFLFKDGKQLARIVGFSEDDIRKLITTNL